MSLDCVVDASVAIKLFLAEPLSARADALFGHLTGSPPARFYVPDLFFVECTNILWKYARRFGYPVESAAQDTADLVRLPLGAVPTAELVEDALKMAAAAGVTAYEAVYAVLAQRLSVPLVTADKALIRQLAESGVDVRFLADWP